MTRNTISLAAGLLLFCAACDATNNPAQRQDLEQQVNQWVNQLVQQSDVPLEELKKLHQLEYQVFRLPLDSAPERIEGALDELGKNRWDCFHVQAARPTKEEPQPSLTFFCKRPSETMLRYVPRSLVGG
ncbi:MAG: hypothetical protein KDD69_01305 [Bdellovibrionales bacterium]|nr:hypothetical protein [Bdellovibrionales bacterium]